MSSLLPEPVLRSSASGLALPSSVAGRDGTRLKYRPGPALRTNSRVARKCPPFLVHASTTRLIGRACPGNRHQRRRPRAAPLTRGCRATGPGQVASPQVCPAVRRAAQDPVLRRRAVHHGQSPRAAARLVSADAGSPRRGLPNRGIPPCRHEASGLPGAARCAPAAARAILPEPRSSAADPGRMRQAGGRPGSASDCEGARHATVTQPPGAKRHALATPAMLHRVPSGQEAVRARASPGGLETAATASATAAVFHRRRPGRG